MKRIVGHIAAVSIVVMGLSFALPASAGFLDKLNDATRKLNDASQRMDQASQQVPKRSGNIGTATKFEKTKTTNAVTGEWGDQVTCAGPNSATCQNGMDNLMNCMHQAKGYYFRLVAANLEEKSKDPNWSVDERAMLQADIKSVKDAIQTDNVVDPDPNEPQRWLTYLSPEEQQELNRVNAKYAKEVHDDCDKRFGGMSQFSSN